MKSNYLCVWTSLLSHRNVYTVCTNRQLHEIVVSASVQSPRCKLYHHVNGIVSLDTEHAMLRVSLTSGYHKLSLVNESSHTRLRAYLVISIIYIALLKMSENSHPVIN